LKLPSLKKIDGELPRVFWFYLVFVAVSVSGYAHFQLISYHFSLSTLFSDAQIPVFFAVAMGVDALVALIVGPLFDRAGLRVLLAVPILSIPITPLAFSTNHVMALSGVIFWGAVMGIQESIMRAAIADLTPVSKRGSAYGIFNVVYGLSWLLGSTVMGLLYGIGVAYIISFSVVLESCAILLLAFL
jgi:hypothetical protein